MYEFKIKVFIRYRLNKRANSFAYKNKQQLKTKLKL
jgi:abortive infection bacteriophage resistance protein